MNKYFDETDIRFMKITATTGLIIVASLLFLGVL